MSDTNLLPILDTLDLTNVDLNRPLVKHGTIVEGKISKMEVVPNKNKSGHNLSIEVKTTAPCEAADGRTLNATFPLYDTISLTQTEKYDPRERLAKLQVAVLGEQRVGFRIQDYLGATVMLKVTIQEDKEGVYPPKNVIQFLKRQ